MPVQLTLGGSKPRKLLHNMGYAKLFSSITESSLWSEPKEVRLLFVTMLAKADSAGFVEASALGLARVANLSISEVEAALGALEGPDLHSKNPENDGRRVMKVPGGWAVINYDLYRNRQSEEERREYMREYMRKYRVVNPELTDVNKSKENPSASACLQKGECEGKDWRFPKQLEQSTRFKSKWDKWRSVRKAMGKRPKDWHGMFQEQLDWLGDFDEASAIEILAASIRNNWQGLFPPKQQLGASKSSTKQPPKDV